jgi:hypothetical protein
VRIVNFFIEVERALPILLSMLVLLWLIAFVLYYRFLAYLKKNYVEAWRELGSPSMIISNTARSNFLALSYLKRRKYLQMDDKNLSRRARLFWNYSVAYLFCFAICIFIIITTILRKV